jgi:hypothetical protein
MRKHDMRLLTQLWNSLQDPTDHKVGEAYQAHTGRPVSTTTINAARPSHILLRKDPLRSVFHDHALIARLWREIPRASTTQIVATYELQTGKPVSKSIALAHRPRDLPPIRHQAGEKPPRTCLSPDCGCRARSKGLCTRCHTAALVAVAAGRTTWKELFKLGLAHPGAGAGELPPLLAGLDQHPAAPTSTTPPETPAPSPPVAADDPPVLLQTVLHDIVIAYGQIRSLHEPDQDPIGIRNLCRAIEAAARVLSRS